MTDTELLQRAESVGWSSCGWPLAIEWRLRVLEEDLDEWMTRLGDVISGVPFGGCIFAALVCYVADDGSVTMSSHGAPTGELAEGAAERLLQALRPGIATRYGD